MPDQHTAKIAVFIDFENISLSAANHFGEFDLGLLLKAIQKRGRVTIKRAYGDWSRLVRYRDALRENAVELVQLYSYNYQQGGKNRADIRLVIDVMESLFTLDYIDTLVIASGDSDFSPLMSKAREYGKYTIGLGVQASTSDLLIKACDEFIFYDDLVAAAYEQTKMRREETVSEPMTSANEVSMEAPLQSSAQSAKEKLQMTGAPTTPITLPPPLITTATGSLPSPSSIVVSRSERETLRYYFDDIRLAIITPEARANILAELLEVVEPGSTLNHAIDRLKARYDFENVYRKREDIRTVTRLVYRAGLFDFGEESPSLSAYVRNIRETDSEQAGRMVDQTLLRMALEANLTLTLPGAASVFFAPVRDEGYCAALLDELLDQDFVERANGRYTIRQTDGINRWLQSPEVAEVRQDLMRCAINGGRLSREDADRNFETAHELRRHDFVASADYALRGVKMLQELYLRREPGLGIDGFLWGVASYCSARAGISFRKRDYITARQYYLAFFWIAQEGDYAWELLRPLLPSLLSYFWMTLSHEVNVRVNSFSGHTAPGEAVIALVNELNDMGLKKMENLAFELASVNAAQLRSLIAQIETAAPSPLQQSALAILNSAHDRFMGVQVN